MMEKVHQMAIIDFEIELCQKCQLCQTRNNVVVGKGSLNTKVMFVGEAPGKNEDEQGEPFVGRAGKLLDQWIEFIGLTRKDVYMANLVKCRPPDNRNPLPEEIESCLPYLEKQIEIIKPRVIMSLGAFALRGLYLDKNIKISQVRGRELSYKGTPVIPTFHPAFLLRRMTKENKDFVKHDLLLVKKFITSENS